MADKVLLLKKFYVQSASQSTKYYELWARDQDDAEACIGELKEDEFVIDEDGWREYQMHYGLDEQEVDQDLCDKGWFSHLNNDLSTLPWAPVVDNKSERPEGWTSFGTPTPRLRQF